MSSSANERLDDAFFDHDLQGMRDALIVGADVNAPLSKNDRRPLWAAQFLTRIRLTSVGPGDDNGFYNAAAELVISRAYVTALDATHPGLRYADSAYNSLSNVVGSTIVMRAAQECAARGEIFRMDLSGVFSTHSDATSLFGALFGRTEATADYDDGTRRDLRKEIISIHRYVGQRLAEPNTKFEKEVAAALPPSERDYWQSEMIFPSLHDLPLPAGEYIAAKKAAWLSLGEGWDLLQKELDRAKGSVTDPAAAASMDMAADDAHEALDRMRELEASGRAGFRKPRAKKSEGPSG